MGRLDDATADELGVAFLNGVGILVATATVIKVVAVCKVARASARLVIITLTSAALATRAVASVSVLSVP